MSEKKLYAVKNDKGEYLSFKHKPPCWNERVGANTTSISTAIEWAKRYGGYVLCLYEKQLEIVTPEEAEMLECCNDPCASTSGMIRSHFDEHGRFIKWSKEDDERLIRAHVNGYTVAKEKRYLLPMEGFGEHQGYSYMEDGIWYINTAPTQTYAVKHGYTVTKDEYDSAPNWVKVLNPVEVTDDGIR